MPFCPVDTCYDQRLGHHLMCCRHWLLLPRILQREVSRLYRDVPGSDEQMEAAADAVEFINILCRAEAREQGRETRAESQNCGE